MDGKARSAAHLSHILQVLFNMLGSLHGSAVQRTLAVITAPWAFRNLQNTQSEPQLKTEQETGAEVELHDWCNNVAQ